MNTSTRGANRPQSLTFAQADELDRRVVSLSAELLDLLELVAELATDHRHERRLKHIKSHIRVAAGRVERVRPYARQLWMEADEADIADQGGRNHG